MYFWYVDACKGTQYVCCGVNFKSNNCTWQLICLRLLKLEGSHGFKTKSIPWQVFLDKENYCVCQRQGVQLVICATSLNYVVWCKCLGMLEPFHGSCFKHVMSKACQCAIT
jgi:hypothetical protein